MIRFGFSDIKGFHSPVTWQPPQWNGKVRNFFGLNGVSEIFSHRGERRLMCNIWLAEDTFTNDAAVYAACDALDERVGDFAQLREIDDPTYPARERIYPRCTFLGFTPRPIAGQTTPEIVVGKFQPIADPIHVIFGSLVWRQLRIDGD